MECHPRLRAVEAHSIVEEGHPYLLLRDPLQLTERALLVPQELGPLLLLCDGTRDLDGLAAALAVRYGLQVRPDLLRQFVQVLDEALLLDNERFAQAHAAALASFRGLPYRAPALAGQAYPAEAGPLQALLQGYLDALEDEPELAGLPAPRGLITPHIDYDRGGAIYARVWSRAAAAARAAERVIILGTDHNGNGSDVSLTRQHYATPFGVLPTPGEAVERLAAAVGEQSAFEGELFHQKEHSIELAAVWLHFIRGGTPCELVPILCGPLARLLQPAANPEDDLALSRLVEALRAIAAERRTLVVAAADLAHVGPAFGGRPLEAAGRARLQSADEALLSRVRAGDAEGFLAAIRENGNEHNVCGVSAIYLALRLLGDARGEQVAYASCPADDHDTSAVTVCGVLLR